MLDHTATRSLVVSLSGEYDCARIEELHAVVLGAHEGQSLVTVDVRDVTFLDSAGLKALLSVRSALRDAGAVMVLDNPQPNIVRVLTVTKTAQIFGVPSARDAPRRVGRGPRRADDGGQPVRRGRRAGTVISDVGRAGGGPDI